MCAAAGGARGQSAPDTACTAPAHRQFDFWLGDWEVVDSAGRVMGHNRITRSMNGCVVHERWSGAGGTIGESFNIYQPTSGKWHQTWVDSDGNLLLLNGGLVNGAMVLVGETLAGDGSRRLHRISYWRLASGQVRQVWEISPDGGSSWTRAFDGTYRAIGHGSHSAGDAYRRPFGEHRRFNAAATFKTPPLRDSML